MASLNEQITAISLTMTLGCVLKYLHVGVNTSVCMAGHFAGAFNIDFAKLSLCNIS